MLELLLLWIVGDQSTYASVVMCLLRCRLRCISVDLHLHIAAVGLESRQRAQQDARRNEVYYLVDAGSEDCDVLVMGSLLGRLGNVW